MKNLLLLFTLSFCFMSQAQTISDIRNLSIGTSVTVRGVVSNGTELGAIRYVQDETAGIACYGTNLSSIAVGDSITATGVLFDFGGLLELSPTTTFTNHGPVIPNTPLIIPISSADELLESQLIRFENVTFVQTGTFAIGNSTVQITDGNNTFDVRINGSTNIDGSAIPTGPVTITGLLGQYNTNYQIIPRFTSDIVAYVAPQWEINVKINGSTVLNNGSYVIGNTGNNTLTIENTGTQALSVSSTLISGANASEFNTTLSSASVLGLGSQSFPLTFTPTANGSRFATITIVNNDNDENPYIINLLAVGLDNLATEPNSNPTNLNFSNIQAYTLSGAYTAASNTEKYLVLWSKGAPVSGIPTDANTYFRGDIIGNSKVAYLGAGTSFIPRGVRANQNYYFAVYGFNGPAGFENYKTTSPATGNCTSTGLNIGSYYSGISTSSSTFIADLSTLIGPHNFISYFNYKQTVMNQFEVRDTTGGQSFVTCSYTGENKVFNDPFDWTTTGYSREHTFCHSWMPTFPCDNPEQDEYTDQHNLYPTNFANANAYRSNLPLNEITGNVLFNYLEGSVGYNGSQMVYEPKASQKGNSARSIFYMATAYNGQNNLNWAIPNYQDQEILKTWHFSDLPDSYEIARQEYIYSVQDNRNPYIDSINYACHISFSNMTYLDIDCNVGLEEQLQSNFSVFPVPSNGKVYAQVNGTNITEYKVTDLLGRVVVKNKSVSLPVLEIDGQNLKSGKYLIEVTTEFGKTKGSFIIE